MSFSTPEMTGDGVIPPLSKQKGNPSINAMNYDNQRRLTMSPWHLGAPATPSPWHLGAPATPSPWQLGAPATPSPWQLGAPATPSPWQLGAPESQMCSYENYTRGVPWPGVVPMASGLAPVHINVISESEANNTEKIIPTKLTGDEQSTQKSSTHWHSAEELAEALFPIRHDEHFSQSMHAKILENHKLAIEDCHDSIHKCHQELSSSKNETRSVRQESNIYREALQNHKTSIDMSCGLLELQSKKLALTAGFAEHQAKKLVKCETDLRQNKNMTEELTRKLQHNSNCLVEVENKTQKTEVKFNDILAKQQVELRDFKKQIDTHQSLKENQALKRDFENVKLRIQKDGPLTEAKLRELHLRTSQLELDGRKLEQKFDTQLNSFKHEVLSTLNSRAREVTFDHLTAPRRKGQ